MPYSLMYHTEGLNILMCLLYVQSRHCRASKVVPRTTLALYFSYLLLSRCVLAGVYILGSVTVLYIYGHLGRYPLGGYLLVHGHVGLFLSRT